MIAHLIRSDWQRFHKFLVFFWLALAVASLPWFAPPSTLLSWVAAESSYREASGSLDFQGGSPFLSAEIIRYFLSCLTLGATAFIAISGTRWQAARPLSHAATILARLAEIALWIALPMAALNAAILLTQGFPLSIVLAESAIAALLLFGLHGLTFSFARQCRNLFIFLAALSVTLLILSVLLPHTHPLDSNFLHLYFLNPWCRIPAGSLISFAAWIALGLSFIWILPRLFRLRPASSAAPALAAFSVGLAAFLSHRIPPSSILTRGPSIPPYSTLEISLASPPRIVGSGLSDGTTVSFELATHPPLPEGVFVTWAAHAKSPYSFLNLPLSTMHSDVDHAAIRSATRDAYSTPDNLRHGNSQPYFRIPSKILDRSSRVDLPVLGRVFRYEQRASLPLPVSPRIIPLSTGRLSIASLSHPSPFALEASLQSPLFHHFLDPSSSLNPFTPFEDLRFLLWIPSLQTHVLLQRFSGEFSPVASSLSLQRAIWILPHSLDKPDLDLTGAELRIFQPVVLATLSRTISLDVRQAPSSVPTGWLVIENDGLEPRDYALKEWPRRPDPETATEAEVARYLRSVSAAYMSPIAAGDLAAFADRFPELFTLHAMRGPVVEAIRLGVSESRRDRVVDTIRRHPDLVAPLARVIRERRWQKDLKNEIVAALSAPPLNTHLAMTGESRNQLFLLAASFSDPELDSILLEEFRVYPSRAKYDFLRSRPDLATELDRLVREQTAALNPAALLAMDSPGIAWWRASERFDIPLRHGDPQALEKLFAFWELLPARGREGLETRIRSFFAPETSGRLSLDLLFTRHSAADFTFQPFTSQWQLRSLQP